MPSTSTENLETDLPRKRLQTEITELFPRVFENIGRAEALTLADNLGSREGGVALHQLVANFQVKFLLLAAQKNYWGHGNYEPYRQGFESGVLEILSEAEYLNA